MGERVPGQLCSRSNLASLHSPAYQVFLLWWMRTSDSQPPKNFWNCFNCSFLAVLPASSNFFMQVSTQAPGKSPEGVVWLSVAPSSPALPHPLVALAHELWDYLPASRLGCFSQRGSLKIPRQQEATVGLPHLSVLLGTPHSVLSNDLI